MNILLIRTKKNKKPVAICPHGNADFTSILSGAIEDAGKSPNECEYTEYEYCFGITMEYKNSQWLASFEFSDEISLWFSDSGSVWLPVPDISWREAFDAEVEQIREARF